MTGMSKQYAVNLIALMNLAKDPEQWPAYWLLRDILTETVVQDQAEDMGKASLLVREDVTEERWSAIVAILRVKLTRWYLPLYENDGKGWRRVP